MRNFFTLALLCSTLPLYAGVQGDLRTGGKLYQQKKYGQALATYNQILQQHPTQQEAALGAGTAAYYLKDYQTAQSAFQQAAQQDTPRQTDALFNLGNAYYRAKNTDQAQQAYRQAILKNPKDKEAIHNLQLLLEEKQNQQNQNNQNDQNQDKNSPNQNNQGGQTPQAGGAQEQDASQQPTSQADKDAADRVMQMAQEKQAKQQPRGNQNTADSQVEKDW